MYFTDVFEIGYPGDATSFELSKIIHAAKSNSYFDTTNFEMSTFFRWREEKEYLLSQIDEHKELIQSKFKAGLDIYNERVYKAILFNIEDDTTAKKLNKKHFEEMKI